MPNIFCNLHDEESEVNQSIKSMKTSKQDIGREMCLGFALKASDVT